MFSDYHQDDKITSIRKIPPICGVTRFFIIWDIGLSWIMGQKICFFENILIKGPPTKNTTVSDVITESPVLKVKYLNTFKNEYCSTNEVKKLYNIGCSFYNTFRNFI